MTETPFTLNQLISGVEMARIVSGGNTPVSGITYDSRAVVPGNMFVALRGGYSDGHEFLQQARGNGATSCLIDREPSEVTVEGYAAVIVVPDCRQALARVARNFYGDPSRHLRLVGITGTDGKTTTSFMTEYLLRSSGYQTGLIGTISTIVPGKSPRSSGRQTTPESLETQRLLAEMRSAVTDVVILETSSHGLETHRVEGCQFDIGLVTNITHEHLDFHGSLTAYRRAKARLFEHVSGAVRDGGMGVGIVNLDDPGARSVLPFAENLTLIGYGIDPSYDPIVTATGVEVEPGGYRFKLGLAGGTFDTGIPMIGSWNLSNALAAVSVGHALGVDPETLARELQQLPSVPGRMQSIRAGQPFQVIVDYAHTAPALTLVLHAAREATDGRVMVLFGSAGERDIAKRAEMGAVAARLSDYFVVTSEDPRFEDPDAIIDQIVVGATESGARESVDFDRLEDRHQAIERILDRAVPGDTVILAGKGHETSMLYGSKARTWDEAQVARDVLNTMGYSAIE
jgi:UDP-N-acetylmuramoyl-L-alanyl-D-glutamate--2,6-diaminopimelate ligase